MAKQLGKNSWERTVGTGKPIQEAGTRQLDQTVRQGQAGEEREDIAART